MAESPKRLFYLIRWMKYQNPTFQFAEMMPTAGGRYTPNAPVTYPSLNLIFLWLKRTLSQHHISLLTLGLTEEEKKELARLMAAQPNVELLKHMPRPIGKRADGTAYRVFLVDPEMDTLKIIKQEITREHFEIISLARNADAALNFFLSNKNQVDLVVLNLALPDHASYFVMDKMLSSKVGLKVIGVAPTNTPVSSDRLSQLAGREVIPVPVIRQNLIRILSRALGV